ncbi:probable E3 ubiquitin-protein ligase TRIML1 [Antechinus flavipes]|uniref:probable E3 ubiquitin-protein ligase TRIML1 n=1 Tax=Antechinus flavipes TaxID=38775 RepID=UPI002236A5BF|nr:probable E3 ubiquitin-protein ligase TRIML1 [Antechinus flavipes]XP_051820220.1 probable E3 ubiquitin-protein ligase TRIML1 [Antechinus flavipes]
MAAKDLIENFKAGPACSLCLDFFTDPVTARCGHSFCIECLLQCMEGADATLTCPECKQLIQISNLIPSKDLQQLSTTRKRRRHRLLQSMENLTTCDQHGKKETLFCEEDQKLLCESCSLTPEHKDHQVVPVDRAIDKYKVILQENRNILKKKEEEFKNILARMRRITDPYLENVFCFKQALKYEYKKMHEFLEDEKRLHLQLLEQETRDKEAKSEKKMAEFSQQIQLMQRKILNIQENMDKAPLELIQGMKSSLDGVEELLLQEPDLETGPEVWTTYHTTGFKKMLLSHYRDITLDPETVGPHLIVSEDLKHLKCGIANNEGYGDFGVLGAQTFTSGKHYWEVELGDNIKWEVGVCQDPLSTRGNRSILVEDIIALEGFRFGDNFLMWGSEEDDIVSKAVKKLGIFLDYEEGNVTFYNATEEIYIYSSPKKVFQGPVRPYFCISIHNEENIPGSLIICPKNN